MLDIKSNKDINGLLTAMDKLTKDELAIELNPTCCPDEDICDCEIPFCCAVNLPQGFTYEDAMNNEARFTIAKCCVTKISCVCTVDSTVDICGQPVMIQSDVLVTKVFGCINFHVAVEGLLGDCGLELTSDGIGGWTPLDVPLDPAMRKTFACCSGCICVDKIVDVDPVDPTIGPCFDSTSELECSEILLTEFEVVNEDCEEVPTLMPTPTPPFACNQILKISGKLRLQTGNICP